MIYKMLSLASPRAKWAMLAEIKVMPNPQYANSFILSGTISEFTRVGPGPRWLDGALGASNSSAPFRNRSEEHTSELQSRLHLVCRLLLEKKKKHNSRPSS